MTEREALKLALEALEWNLPVIEDHGVPNQLKMQHKAITSIYEALAQPEQERCEYCKRGLKTICLCGMKAQPAVSETHKQKPVACMMVTMGEVTNMYPLVEMPDGEHYLYTTPPQRTWVGLTDEEFQTIIMSDPHATVPVRLWQLIQDKLKEKNT